MRITKKTIATELKSLNPTRIYRIAKICGINIENKVNLFNWIEFNAPTKKVLKSAYKIAFESDRDKLTRNGFFKPSKPQNKVLRTIQDAKSEKKVKKGRYSKILIFGNTNIYWASPIYQHSDYNKCIAMPRNAKTEKLANLINQILIK